MLSDTVDGSEILHQLRLVVYPTINRVLYIPGDCLGFQPSTVSHPNFHQFIFTPI